MEDLIPTNEAFWRGKRVLITGHTGFKGSWLSLWLQRYGADVAGFSLNPSAAPNLFDLASVKEGMKSIIGDIRTLESLSKAFADVKPEIVFHLAAQPLVRRSYEDPVETYSTNVMGVVHVLEMMRRHPGVVAGIVVTSDKCYENEERSEGYVESDPMGGRDPYSSSKGCAELVASAYARSYFSNADERTTKIATARSGNVIGGGDWSRDRLISDLLGAFAENRKPLIRNPNATRPWLHALDSLFGYLTLARKLYERGDEFAGSWNFGPKETDVLSVAEIADALAKSWGEGAGWERDQGANPREASVLRLDSSKARRFLSWRNVLDVRESLAWTMEWHRRWLSGASAKEITLKQISDYENMQVDFTDLKIAGKEK